MAIINPLPEAPWFSIDEDAYFMYLLKGYEISYDSDWWSVEFRMDGKWHREDGPAVIWKDGSVAYCINGREVESN